VELGFGGDAHDFGFDSRLVEHVAEPLLLRPGIHQEDPQHAFAPAAVELDQVGQDRHQRAARLALPPDVDGSAVETLRAEILRGVGEDQRVALEIVDDHLQMAEERRDPFLAVRPAHHDDVRADRVERMALEHGLERHVEFRRVDHGGEHLPFALFEKGAQLPETGRPRFPEIPASREDDDLDHAQDSASLAHQHGVFDQVAAPLRRFGEDGDGRPPVFRVERQVGQQQQV